jgi:hypothetical protein
VCFYLDRNTPAFNACHQNAPQTYSTFVPRDAQWASRLLYPQLPYFDRREMTQSCCRRCHVTCACTVRADSRNHLIPAIASDEKVYSILYQKTSKPAKGMPTRRYRAVSPRRTRLTLHPKNLTIQWSCHSLAYCVRSPTNCRNGRVLPRYGLAALLRIFQILEEAFSCHFMERVRIGEDGQISPMDRILRFRFDMRTPRLRMEAIASPMIMLRSAQTQK